MKIATYIPPTDADRSQSRRQTPNLEGAEAVDLNQFNVEEADELPSTVSMPFPTDALPEPLRDMVKHAARQTSGPESLCAAAGLGISAASMGSAFVVQSAHGRETRGNLYLLAFAGSGTGKGQSFNLMASPWLEAGKAMMEEWVMEDRPRILADLELATTDLELAKKDRRNKAPSVDAAAAENSIRDAVKRKTVAESALAREPLLNIGNVTLEAILEAVANSPGEASTIFSSEARDIVDNLLGRYSKDGKGGDETIFLQGYSGDPVTHKRKGKDALIAHSPCLTFCLAVQPDIWERMASSSRLMESGFLARAMTFNSHAAPMRPSGHSVPKETADAWRAVIQALLSRRANPFPPDIIIPTVEAKSVIDALANESADNREAGGRWVWCESHAARLAENAWRLAMVFHALQNPQGGANIRLSQDTATRAVTVARWFFTETLALLAPMRSQRIADRMDKLATIFRDKQTTILPTWKLCQNHGFTKSELQTLEAEFPRRLKIVTTPPTSNGGRPSETVHLLTR